MSFMKDMELCGPADRPHANEHLRAAKYYEHKITRLDSICKLTALDKRLSTFISGLRGGPKVALWRQLNMADRMRTLLTNRDKQ